MANALEMRLDIVRRYVYGGQNDQWSDIWGQEKEQEAAEIREALEGVESVSELDMKRYIDNHEDWILALIDAWKLCVRSDHETRKVARSADSLSYSVDMIRMQAMAMGLYSRQDMRKLEESSETKFPMLVGDEPEKPSVPPRWMKLFVAMALDLELTLNDIQECVYYKCNKQLDECWGRQEAEAEAAAAKAARAAKGAKRKFCEEP